MPKVTVCIAVYNGAETLSLALDSVFAQTYKDFNVLVLDDGSTDNSAEIASRYDCKVIRQENQGLGAARRRMVEEADGELIGFNDHDDVWMPDKLEKQVPVHEEAGAILSYTGGEWVLADSRVVIRDDTAPPGSCSYDHLLPRNLVIGISALFGREQMLAAGNFSADVRVGSDLYGWYLLAGRGDFAYVAHPLVRYYQRAGQNTEASYKAYEADRHLFEDHVLKRFEELFANAPSDKRAYYRRCLLRYIAKTKRAMAHFARVEKQDYRLAMRHHWGSIAADPANFAYWASFLKNALLWRTQ